jgi:hypothetical protein
MTAKLKTRKNQAAPKAATIPSWAADDFMGFFRGRDPLEIKRIKATLEAAFPRPSKAEETERDTALHEAEEGQERLTDLDLADEIDTMKRRCSGLEMAIMGANEITRDGLGVCQLATDLANEMEQLAQDFAAERKLRQAEEH